MHADSVTILQEAEQYLTEQKATMMEHQIPPKSYKLIESLIMEIERLQNGIQKALDTPTAGRGFWNIRC